MYVSVKFGVILRMERSILPFFKVSRINVMVSHCKKMQKILAGVREAAGSRNFGGARLPMVCMSLQNLEEFCIWEVIFCHCLKLAE